MQNDEQSILLVRKAVCRRILSGMIKKDWTQKQLAEAWGKPESQISKMLNGKMDMQLSTLTELEEVLGIELIRKDWQSL